MAATATRTDHRYAEADFTDFAHTGPDTLAGRYLRTFWHPVYRAEDLPAGRAKPITIMNESFTLYRGESGTPHLIAFRCAHRGTQLSTGWVEGDDIRCFYHGWKYDPSGQCIEQPAEPEPFCQKIKLRSYPTEEYLGLVFAYLDESDPPPLPRYPDFEDANLSVEIKNRGSNYFQHLENDGAHIYFVHRQGNWRKDGIPGPSVAEDEWGPGDTRLRNQAGMPNITTHVRPDTDGRGDVIRWVVPITDERHSDVSVFPLGQESREQYYARRGPGYTESSDLGEDYTRRILAGELKIEEFEAQHRGSIIPNVQDAVAQVGQGVFADRDAEHLGYSDLGVVLRRKLVEREMRALADGRPLKQWTRPERFYRANVRRTNGDVRPRRRG